MRRERVNENAQKTQTLITVNTERSVKRRKGQTVVDFARNDVKHFGDMDRSLKAHRNLEYSISYSGGPTGDADPYSTIL